MVWLMRKCVDCKKYTIRTNMCPYCGGGLRVPHPADFSPDDKYAKYKGMMRSLSANEGNDNSGEKQR